MTHFTIDFPQISLAFTEIGEGDQILLCTHGYQQTKQIFTELFKEIPQGWKILAFDQPMHGDSIWENTHIRFDESFFKLLWQQLLEKYPNASWSLLGFSMGGKTSIFLEQTAPVRIQKMLLIAPAGVITHPLNTFFSYHFWGSKIFLFFLRHPLFILSLFEFFYKRKWMKPFAYRFAKIHFEEKQVRDYMQKFVPIYHKFHFDFKEYAAMLSAKNIELHVLWGSLDEVLPVKQAYLLKKHLPSAQLTIMEGQKHNMIQTNKEIVAAWVIQGIL